MEKLKLDPRGFIVTTILLGRLGYTSSVDPAGYLKRMYINDSCSVAKHFFKELLKILSFAALVFLLSFSAGFFLKHAFIFYSIQGTLAGSAVGLSLYEFIIFILGSVVIAAPIALACVFAVVFLLFTVIGWGLSLLEKVVDVATPNNRPEIVKLIESKWKKFCVPVEFES